VPKTRVLSFVSIPRLEIVEIALIAGFDGVLIDLEHGPITVSDLPAMIAAVGSHGGDCLIRVESSYSDAIGKALDAGASGIVVPRVGNVQAAAHAVDAARFSRGRGFNPFVRAGGYGGLTGFAQKADANVEVICMIEGRDGLDNARDIVRVDGVTGVFLGPYDLSVALGHPGDVRHPSVVEAIDLVIETAVAEGCSVGVFSSDPVDAQSWRQKGADMLFIGVDADVLRRAYIGLLAQFVGDTPTGARMDR
jgi:4-hydroxy-2-oxoheptanedioate aldolase